MLEKILPSTVLSFDEQVAAADRLERDNATCEAVTAWQNIMAEFPENIDAILNVGRLLKQTGKLSQARAVVRVGVDQFPDDERLAVDHGWLVHSLGDFSSAAVLFQQIRNRFPASLQGYLGGGLTYSMSGAFDEADIVYRAAFSRFPVEFYLIKDFACNAQRRPDLGEAIRRMQMLLTLFPDAPDSYSHMLNLLQEAKHFDAADRLLVEAMSRFPKNVMFRILYAEVANCGDDPVEAIKRWRSAIRETDNDPRAVIGFSAKLINLGEFEDAEALLVRAIECFPADPRFAICFADIATRQEKHVEALARYESVITRFPTDRDGLRGLIDALITSGRFADARMRIAEALGRYPAAREILERQATLASVSGDWSEAERVWQWIVDRHPDDGGARQHLGIAKSHVQLALLAESRDLNLFVESSDLMAAEAGDMSSLMFGFESLGDNCEFGIVQRYFRAEPLGLLRWAGTMPEQLIAAAETCFDGVGDPDNTDVFTWPNGEYGVSDTRYGMMMHTFTYNTAFAYDVFFKDQARRSRYLKEKLIDEIQEAKKILVYKSEEITTRQAIRLAGALRRIGPSTLLVVRLRDGSHAPGTVEQVSDGLFFGYIDKFAPYHAPTTGTSYACWATICIRTLELWRGMA